MQAITVKELKQIQLDLLAAIDTFCRKNNIKYSIAFGTLLGQVRHGGYIPWDDDIDIMMPRADYDRFLKEFQSEFYKVIDFDTDNSYSQPYAKVYDSRTKLDEFTNTKNKYGINIDIFPLDKVPVDIQRNSWFLREKKFYNLLHTFKIVRLVGNMKLKTKMVVSIAKLFMVGIRTETINKKLISLSKKYQNLSDYKIGIIAPTDNRYEEIFSKEVFESYEDCKFENLTVKRIVRYHEYLQHSYGDYMQLPPEEKRISHHAFYAVWIDS